MRPVLFELIFDGRAFAISSYATFMSIGIFGALGLGVLIAHRRGLSWKRTSVLFVCTALVGVLGSRVFDYSMTIITNQSDPSPLLNPSLSNLSLYGLLLFATPTALALCRILSLPIWQVADSAAPALGLGISTMRLGCYLNGCCFGKPCGAPWAVVFPFGSPAWSHQILSGETGILGLGGAVSPVHPTQLYELVAALILGAISILVIKSEIADGLAFLVFATGFSVFRIANAHFRANIITSDVNSWIHPFIYYVIPALLAALLISRARESIRRRV